MSGKLQLSPELAECWGKLTPQQQSLMLSRIKALASGNEYQAAMEQSGSAGNEKLMNSTFPKSCY